MKIQPTNVPDAVVFEPDLYGDERGFFLETYRETWFEELGIKPHFVQDNHSSSTKGVLRGLHLQTINAQGKLVRVTRGEVFDVVVDLRLDSSTYGQWAGVSLSAENHKILWIPEGFAHGILAVSDSAEVLYKCTELYNPESEITIAWNDETLNIHWPIDDAGAPVLSKKDSEAGPLLKGMGFLQGVWQDGDSSNDG